jgi:hypothetical protein
VPQTVSRSGLSVRNMQVVSRKELPKSRRMVVNCGQRSVSRRGGNVQGRRGVGSNSLEDFSMSSQESCACNVITYLALFENAEPDSGLVKSVATISPDVTSGLRKVRRAGLDQSSWRMMGPECWQALEKTEDASCLLERS